MNHKHLCPDCDETVIVDDCEVDGDHVQCCDNCMAEYDRIQRIWTHYLNTCQRKS
jgi:hypothetical protein